MKYYKIDDIVLSFFKDGAVEITNPIREDGTVLPQHEKLTDVAKQEDGSLYDFYLTIPDANGIYQADTVAIQGAIDAKTAADNLAALEATDKHMVRIAEDLLTLLVTKGVIAETELPADAQAKLASRRIARSKV